jgi:DNA-binding response OmpR family regulator
MRDFLDLHGRILVADDEKVNVDFFKVMLTKIGFEVEIAMDGQEVLEKVGSFAPDLILLDLLMPKMSGFQVAETLKKDDRTKEIPIVVLSAVNDIKEKVDLLGLGIEDYITKPFNFIEIIARIRNILRSNVLKNEVEMRRKDSRLLGDLDAALRQFLGAAEDRAEGILSSLASLRKRLADGSEKDRELVDGSLSAAKDLVESVRKLQESHRQFLASQSEELIETRDAST